MFKIKNRINLFQVGTSNWIFCSVDFKWFHFNHLVTNPPCKHMLSQVCMLNIFSWAYSNLHWCKHSVFLRNISIGRIAILNIHKWQSNSISHDGCHAFHWWVHKFNDPRSCDQRCWSDRQHFVSNIYLRLNTKSCLMLKPFGVVG